MGQQRHWVAGGLAVVQMLVLLSLLVGGRDEPRDAQVTLVAPPVLGAVLAQRVVSDAEFRAVPSEQVGSARRDVVEGRSIAAIVVDLRVERDTLYVAGAQGSDVTAAVERGVDRVESTYGRTVEVEDLVPTRAGDRDARGVYALVGAMVLGGLAIAVVLTWRFGPVARTLRDGLARLAVIAAASMGLGLAAAVVAAMRYDSGFAMWSLVAAATTGAVAVATTALESMFGVMGIGFSMTIFVLTAAPMLRLQSVSLLPTPWDVITPWLPHGAALEAGRGLAYFDGTPLRPLLVLLVWLVLSMMTLAVARRERDRDVQASRELNEQRTGPLETRR